MNAMSPTVGTIMRVMPENVTSMWRQVEELFLPALAMVSTHTAEDVRRAVMTMRAQLWAQIDGTVVQAAATTEFVDYPVGMYVRVWLAGARKGVKFDEEGFHHVMDNWRVHHNCVGFEAIGRHGWLKRFPEAKVEGLVLRWRPE